ncbi:Stf0 family sulfotransferase [Nocardioides sp.]|uniref:Stf0 family sulfotransferase n=1 Tax=Nocardioides sp. TaxID=35761 RepID=UPI0025F5F9B8|nr:Stf0 family sulfotransferase [Nocardioides sp.]
MNHAQQLVGVAGEGRIERTHWGSVRPYVMFIMGRCGSTWLSEMLAETGLAGNPREWLNYGVALHSRHLETETLGGYFATVLTKNNAGHRFGLQVDPDRLRDMLPLIDWEDVFPPDLTPTFFLYRRDIVAQAYSFAHAMKTGIWHTSELKALTPREGLPTTLEVAAQVVRIRRMEEYASSFCAYYGHTPRFIAYEDLVADPWGTVWTILRDLGESEERIAAVDRGTEPTSTAIKYSDDRDLELDRFREDYRRIVDAIERSRFGVDAVSLRDWFAGTAPHGTR